MNGTCPKGHDLSETGAERMDHGVVRLVCRLCKSLSDKAYRTRNRERRAASHRAYLASEKGRAARRRATIAYTSKGGSMAHYAVQEAVRTGRLVRGPCAQCGATKVQAHHPHGYAPEHRLDVEWLCRAHHEAAHHAVAALTEGSDRT